jgi:cell division protein FtsB
VNQAASVLAGVPLCEVVAKRGTSLSTQRKELFGKVGSHCPERQNFRLTDGAKTKFTTKLGMDPAEFAGRKCGGQVLDERLGVEDRVNALREFGEKLVKGRRLLASAALAMIAVGLCAHVLLGNNGWMSYRQKKVEYEGLQQDLQRMDEENRRLDTEIKALKSDPKAIEKEAREQLRYAKPGEVIYLLPEQAGTAQSPPPRDESARR